jgi:hypothetical protein
MGFFPPAVTDRRIRISRMNPNCSPGISPSLRRPKKMALRLREESVVKCEKVCKSVWVVIGDYFIPVRQFVSRGCGGRGRTDPSRE